MLEYNLENHYLLYGIKMKNSQDIFHLYVLAKFDIASIYLYSLIEYFIRFDMPIGVKYISMHIEIILEKKYLHKFMYVRLIKPEMRKLKNTSHSFDIYFHKTEVRQ